jgi:hypothetical protein
MLVKNRGATVMEGKRKAQSVKMNGAGQASYPFQLGNGLRLELRKARMRSRIDERR